MEARSIDVLSQFPVGKMRQRVIRPIAIVIEQVILVVMPAFLCADTSYPVL